jgi:hypothetical protein
MQDTLNNSDRVVITLNEKEIFFMKQIINDEPKIFTDIIVDKTITVAEIPKIVYIITNYFLQKIKKNEDININILNLVKFTIYCLIDELEITVPEIRQPFIVILDYSIDLLKTNIDYIKKEKKNIFNKLYNNIKYFIVRSFSCRKNTKINISIVPEN